VTYAIDFFRQMIFFYNQMAVYLLFGFIVAGILHILFSESLVKKHLGGGTIISVAKASLFGVPLPLCSCGVIPAGISLYRQGASRGSTVSFLISTPQTGVDSILATYGFLGPIYALFRPAAAFISGIAGGIITNFVEKSSGRAGEEDNQKNCLVCKVDLSGEEHFHTLSERVAAVARYAFVELPSDIALWLVIGIGIAAVITIALPDDLLPSVAEKVGSDVVMMLIMTVVAVPIYVCATASIPIAVALIMKGLSPGAAFVFLMAGPATNSATITLIWRVLGFRTLATYLFSIVITSVASGFLLNLVFSASGIDIGAQVARRTLSGTHEATQILHVTGAIVLGLIFLNIFYRKVKRLTGEPEEVTAGEGEKPMIIKVDGMTCQHCASNVRRAIEGVCRADSVNINLETGRVEITGVGCEMEKVRQAIEEMGYKVVG